MHKIALPLLIVWLVGSLIMGNFILGILLPIALAGVLSFGFVSLLVCSLLFEKLRK